MAANGCTQSVIGSAVGSGKDEPQLLDVVCFGALCALRIATVDEYPRADSGAELLTLVELIAADAAIVAMTLRSLGCGVGLISNDVGDDPDGRELLGRLRRDGIVSAATLRRDVRTGFGLTVVDRERQSTWFVFLASAAAGLLAADLSLVDRAGYLYVDVYAQTWQASIRAIDRARGLGLPIMVNLSDWLPGEELDRHLRQGVSIVQSSASGQSVEQAREVCQASFDRYCVPRSGTPSRGVGRVRQDRYDPLLSVMTMGSRGVLYSNASGTYHLPAYATKVVNTAGGGATFSAGLLFGFVQSWPDQAVVSFASALGGLYCSVPNGLGRFSATEVKEFEASRGVQPTKLGGGVTTRA